MKRLLKIVEVNMMEMMGMLKKKKKAFLTHYGPRFDYL